MQIIIAGLGIFCAAGIVILLSFFQDMSGNDKLPILAPMVLIAAFSLTRMKSGEAKSKQEASQ